jgi:HD-GYP domain-containing protein (c-di-GMP phosphodiesterase class II)
LEEKELQLGKINVLITPEQGLKTTTDISISSAINREALQENIKLISELYGQLLEFAKKFYVADALNYSQAKQEIIGFIERAVGLLSVGTKESLRSSLSDYANPADFVYYNVVNVSFLSIEIGLGLGYDRSHLTELGIACFLHDIGIVKYLEIINKTERLSQQDYNKVKQHTQSGIDFLNKWWNDAPGTVFEVISQEHERMDGSGYPRGIKEGDISEFAQIVGLVDVYEAMIHQRPYRDKHTPTETLNTILNNKRAFGYKIIKVLIERIGIFPVGYRVRLNTKEIGVVIKDNPKSPLRPVVSIMFDLSGRQLANPKEIDLSVNPVIYIEECLDCFKKEP